MKTATDISRFIRECLGDEPAEVFEAQADEVEYLFRAMSLDDIVTPTDEMQKKAQALIQAIVIEVIGSYLSVNFGSDVGDLNINADSGLIYDKNMNEIRSVMALSEKQDEILDIMTSRCMAIFCAGRELALKIIARRSAYMREKKQHDGEGKRKKGATRRGASPGRDYEASPPLEQVEIEIMRLERRLPNLSPEEGKRLSALYKLSKAVTS